VAPWWPLLNFPRIGGVMWWSSGAHLSGGTRKHKSRLLFFTWGSATQLSFGDPTPLVTGELRWCCKQHNELLLQSSLKVANSKRVSHRMTTTYMS
jgi:hypothetical protein